MEARSIAPGEVAPVTTFRSNDRILKYLVAIAIIVGIFFRFYNLDYKTFWGDEIVGLVRTLGYTEAEIVDAGPRVRTAADLQGYFHLPAAGQPGETRSTAATIHSLAVEDPQHPPVYYVLARLWVGVAGTSVYALRTLAAIFGTLSIFAMAWLAQELFASRRAAWMAASLFAVSPFAVVYSGEAREYSLWVLITLLSSTFLLKAARTRAWPFWAAFGITTAIGLYVYPLVALVLAAQGVCMLAHAQYRKREVFVPFMLCGIVASICYIPWLFQLWNSAAAGLHGMANFMLRESTFKEIALTFLHGVVHSTVDLGHLDGSLTSVARTVAGSLELAIVTYAMLRLLLRDKVGKSRAFILSMAIVPAAPLVAHDIIAGGMMTSQTRYFATTYSVVALGLAWLFHTSLSASKNRLRASAWTSVYGYFLLTGILSCAIASQASTWYLKANERSAEVAAYINGTESPVVVGDKAVEGDRGVARVLELSYYLKPEVAIRANLHCDGCLNEPPPRIDVFRDLDRFDNVFVLGNQVRQVPMGKYTVQQVGILNDPENILGKFNMFAAF